MNARFDETIEILSRTAENTERYLANMIQLVEPLLRQEHADHETLVANLLAEIARLKQVAEDRPGQSQFEKNKQEIADLENKNHDLLQDINGLLKGATSYRKQIDQLAEQNCVLQNRCLMLTQENHQLRAERDEMTGSRSVWKQTCISLQARLDKIHHVIQCEHANKNNNEDRESASADNHGTRGHGVEDEGDAQNRDRSA